MVLAKRVDPSTQKRRLIRPECKVLLLILKGSTPSFSRVNSFQQSLGEEVHRHVFDLIVLKCNLAVIYCFANEMEADVNVLGAQVEHIVLGKHGGKAVVTVECEWVLYNVGVEHVGKEVV